MPSLDSLVTKLPADPSYSGDEPARPGGLRGFVCPRADAYGGREGIISPGVAAVNGLIPKGMRRVAVGETGASVKKAKDGGVTEVGSYMDYYSGNGVEPDSPEVPAAAPVVPAAPAAPVAHSSGPTAPLPPPVPAAQPSEPFRLPMAPIPRPASLDGEPGVAFDTDRPGMFSRKSGADAGDDTLDGFYDGLGDVGAGTDWMAPAARSSRPDPRAEREAELRARLAGATARAMQLEDRVRSLSAELSAETARADRAEAAARRPAQLPTAETVRVGLAEPEERLKVGGRDWACNVRGAMHVSRGGRSVVLTVSDPGYASELLAAIGPGELAVLSKSTRTYCTYGGRCAKIYGDPGSSDFIAAFWLSVVRRESAAGGREE